MAKPSKPADYGVEAGTVLLGKYRIDAILGHGGMGIVAQATHLQLEERVAIKFLRDDVILDEETMRRFLREAQNAVKLKSEHVARVSDVGTFESGVPYMVMEFLEGIDLGQMLEESGKINPSLAVELLLQACVALAEAHSLGIVHRDIKPGNLFVTWRADGSPLLKILDFGISKAPVGADMNLTQTQSLLGTPAYMSPEQMRSARTVDPRSDIWSLGTVLYEIIQGRRPFEAESFSEMCVKVAVDPPAPLTVPHPPGLDKVILRALEKNQDARYQTIAEMARDLAPFARDRNSALVAVERMTRMLGRARGAGGFDRSEYSSPEAAPRGLMRDLKSAPIALPRGKDGSGPNKKSEPVTPRDPSNLHVGDVTDHDMTLDAGEATAITTMDAAARHAAAEAEATDGTRTRITALEDDGLDTAERRRVHPPDSGGHKTIEEDLSWIDGKSGWTPQSTTAQGATTDPSMAPIELPTQPPEKTALLKAQALAASNAAAAAKAHESARALAAQKARGGAGIPLSPTTPARERIPAATGTPPAAPAQPGAARSAATGQGPGIGATLPGLFPAAIPGGGRSQRAMTPVHGTSTVNAIGSTPSMLPAKPLPARPTGPVADLRPSRVKLMIGTLLLGVAIGVGVFMLTRSKNDDAATTAPENAIDPGPGPGLPPATPSAEPTPAVAAPPTGVRALAGSAQGSAQSGAAVVAPAGSAQGSAQSGAAVVAPAAPPKPAATGVIKPDRGVDKSDRPDKTERPDKKDQRNAQPPGKSIKLPGTRPKDKDKDKDVKAHPTGTKPGAGSGSATRAAPPKGKDPFADRVPTATSPK